MLVQFIIVACFVVCSKSGYTDSCVLNLIETYFLSNATINYIVDSESMDDIHFAMANTRTIADLNSPIQNIAEIHPNYVIFSNNTYLDEIFETLKKSKLWNIHKFRQAKILIILSFQDVTSVCQILRKRYFNEAVIIKNNQFYVYNSLIPKMCNNHQCVAFESNFKLHLKLLKHNTYNLLTLVTVKEAKNSPAYIIIHKMLNLINDVLEINVSRVFVNEENILAQHSNESLITIAVQRRNEVYEMYETSEIYFRDEMAWYLPKPARISTLKILLTIFSIKIWSCVITVFIIACVVWHYLVQNDPKQYPKSYSSSFLSVLTLSLGGSIHLTSTSNFLRIMLIFYTVYSIHICSVFNGSLIGCLTEPPYEEPITSVEKLSESKLPIALYTDGRLLFNGRDLSKGLFHKLKKKVVKIDHFNWSKLIFDLSMHKNFSSFGGVSVAKIYVKDGNKFVDVIKQNTYLATIESVIIMTKGNPAMSVMDLAISRIFEHGLYQKIIIDVIQGNVNLQEPSDTNIKINVTHLLSVFILWIFGMLCSIVRDTLEHDNDAEDKFGTDHISEVVEMAEVNISHVLQLCNNKIFKITIGMAK
ncbi:hypothetical protein FQR65_LT07052 [Abscondita terminalis]|nr:hypothetical protein FQR65_LT07052 [Abscondita terminalis]